MDSPKDATPSSMDTGESNMEHRLVHLDLKGAPPRITYFEQLFPLLHKLGATGLLVEYEDMFPYWGELAELASPNAYSAGEIKRLMELAEEHSLIVIPLIQTFGHFEFVLKHKKFHCLREVPLYPMTLCPLKEESLHVVKLMIDQVMELHPNINSFHIGADEVFHLAICADCVSHKKTNGLTDIQLFFEYVHKVLIYIRDKYPGLSPIMWDDMYRYTDLATLKDSGLGGLVEPMVWYYGRTFHLPEDLWDRLSIVFPSVWAASAFKGATGPCRFATDIAFHVDNHQGWLKLTETDIRPKFNHFRGYAVTGWQRYDHYAVLCELLPTALPSLAICLRLLAGSLTDKVHQEASKDLGFNGLLPLNPFESDRVIPECRFPGSQIYTAMQHLLHAHEDFSQLMADDRLNSWMADYHVQRGFINPVHVANFLPTAQSLLQTFRLLDVELKKVLPEVLYEDAVQEVLGILLKPKIDTLAKVVDTAENQMVMAVKEQQS